MGYSPNVFWTNSFNFPIKWSFTIIAIPWLDSFTFRYSIFNRSQWKITVESPEKNPSRSMIKSLLTSVENTSGAPWTNSCTCLYKVFTGNCFTKCFLRQFLQASSMNPHQNSMGNAPGTHWTKSFPSFPFPYETFIESQWNMFLQLPGSTPLHFFIKPSLKFMGHAPNVSWTNSFNFTYYIIINDQWGMLLQFLGSIPLHFVIQTSIEVIEKCSLFFLRKSFKFHCYILAKIYGNCFWSSLDQFLYMSV